MNAIDAIRASLNAYPEDRLDRETARALLDRLGRAEARIEAVEDVLTTVEDGHSTDPVIRGLFPRMVGTALIRRALDGDA